MPYPSKKFRQNPFTSLRVIRRTRTDRQTDRTKNITSFFGGGNNVSDRVPDFTGTGALNPFLHAGPSLAFTLHHWTSHSWWWPNKAVVDSRLPPCCSETHNNYFRLELRLLCWSVLPQPLWT